MNEAQKAFIDVITSICEWNDPGKDRIRIGHNKDGNIRLSWKYMRKKKLPPYTVTDEDGFQCLSHEEIEEVINEISKILNKTGAIE